MTFAEKLERLIDESGWSRAFVAKKIGREGNSNQVGRWLGKSSTGKPMREKTGKPNKDGTPRRDDGSQPKPHDLIALSDLFSVDIRWLIDDALGWDDQLKVDNPVLQSIRRLPMEAQLAMLRWHDAQPARHEPESKPEIKPERKPGSTGYPKEKPPPRPTSKGKPESGGVSAFGN